MWKTRGSWTQLDHTGDGAGRDLGYDEFVTQTKKELKNAFFREYGIKELDDGSVVNIKTNTPAQHSLDDVMIALDEKGYGELVREFSENIPADLHAEHPKAPYHYPLLTFHGTTSVEKALSIMKYGYISPYDIHPGEGYTLCMHHGNIYGDGVYSSNKIDSAIDFSLTDVKGSQLLIVNIVLPGIVTYHDNERDTGIIYPLDGIYQVPPAKWNPKQRRMIPGPQEKYGESTIAHTRVHEDYYICGSPKRVVPIALLQVGQNHDGSKVTLKHSLFGLWTCFFSKTRDKGESALLRTIVPKALPPIPWYPSQTSSAYDTVFFYRLFDNYFLVDTDPYENVTDRANSDYYMRDTPTVTDGVVVDHVIVSSADTAHGHLSHLRSFTKAIADEHKGSGDVYSILFNAEGHTKTKVGHDGLATAVSQFSAKASTTAQRTATSEHFAASLDLALDIATHAGDDLPQNSVVHNRVTIIYVLVSHELTPEGLTALIDKHYVPRPSTPSASEEPTPSLQPRIAFKLVYLPPFDIHETILTDTVCQLKSSFQTVDVFEDWVQQVSDQKPIAQVLEKVLDENLNIVRALGLRERHVAITYPNGILGEGFVTDLTTMPRWDVRVHGERFLLYKGGYIDAVRTTNSNYTRTRFIMDPAAERIGEEVPATGPRFSKVKAKNPQLDIQFKRIADGGKDASHLLLQSGRLGDCARHVALARVLINVLARLKLYVVQDPARFRLYEPIVSRITEPALEVLTNLQGETIRQSLVRNPQDAKLVTAVTTQLGATLNQVQTFARVRLKGEWFDRFMAMKFGMKIAKRAEMISNVTPFEKNEAIAKVTGYGIHLVTQNCSTIEPWTLIVAHVSKEEFTWGDVKQGNRKSVNRDGKTTHGVMRAKDGARVTDILPLEHGTVSGQDLPDSSYSRLSREEQKMVMAYSFTRTPQAYIPSQPIALRTIGLVSIVETLFLRAQRKRMARGKAGTGSMTQALPYFSVPEVYDMMESLSRSQDHAMAPLIKSITSASTIDPLSSYVTESAGVLSLCRLLGALCRPEAAPIFHDPQLYHRLARVMVCECTARICRTVKAKGMTPEQHLQQVLGVSLDDNLETIEADWHSSDSDTFAKRLNRVVKQTSYIWLKRNTNCSMFALVGMLEFLESYHDQRRPLSLEAGDESGLSMHNFFTKHFSSYGSGREVQVALILQGIQLNKSSQREGLVFENPRAIIQHIVSTQCNILRAKIRAAEMREARSSARLARTIERLSHFLAYHTTAKLFDCMPHPSDQISLNNVPLSFIISDLYAFICAMPMTILDQTSTLKR